MARRLFNAIVFVYEGTSLMRISLHFDKICYFKVPILPGGSTIKMPVKTDFNLYSVSLHRLI
jgi:hypothetical protein